MSRFFAFKEDILGDEIILRGEDYKHIKNVLRMDIGEEMTVCDGEGTDHSCRIKSFEEGCVRLSVEKTGPCISELPCRIYLFQALPKLDKMDTIIQKAVELGAYAVVPVSTKRCIVKLDQEKGRKKTSRWQEISRAAAKQSGRGIIPKICEPVSFNEALKMAKDLEGAIIPYENCLDTADTKKTMEELKKCSSIGIFIGPEGGFEEEEVKKAFELGIKPVTLGKRILRTETAGMTVLSILMFAVEMDS